MTDAPARDAATSPSQTDVVIDGLTRMVTGGELAPGARLPVERDLAARFGVSRGPLREAVRALVTLGVLETRPGTGTFVTSLDPDRLLRPLGLLADLTPAHGAADLLAVRRVLECEAAALAARHASEEELAGMAAVLDGVPDAGPAVDAGASLAGPGVAAALAADTAFHRAVARASRNEPLAALVDGLTGRTLHTRLWRAVTEAGAVAASDREHRAILAALAAREPDAARALMAVHLLGVERHAAQRSGPSRSRVRLRRNERGAGGRGA